MCYKVIIILFVLLFSAHNNITAVCFGESPANRQASLPEAGLLYFGYHRYQYNTEAVNNPNIIGGLFWVTWSEVEEVKGFYDWSDIENRIKPWLDAGKCVALRIGWSGSGLWPDRWGGHTTPHWVWREGAAMAYSAATRTEVPLQWDPIYKRYAFQFMKALAAKYDGHPRILFIDVSPGGETNPFRGNIMRFQGEGGDSNFKEVFRNTTSSDGRKYSESLWLETVKEYIDCAATTFTATRLLVTLNRGGLDGPEKFRAIGDYCTQKGFFVGQNGLQKNSYLDDSERRRVFGTWAAKTKLYFEMVAPTDRPGTGTLMEIMKAAERIHCSYLGVSGPDVQRAQPHNPEYDPEYKRALEYGATAMRK